MSLENPVKLWYNSRTEIAISRINTAAICVLRPPRRAKRWGPCVSRSRKDGNKSSKCSSYLRFTRLAARVFIGLPFDVRQIRGRPGFLLRLAKEQKGIEGVQNDSTEEPSLCRRGAKRLPIGLAAVVRAIRESAATRRSAARSCRRRLPDLSREAARRDGLFSARSA